MEEPIQGRKKGLHRGRTMEEKHRVELRVNYGFDSLNFS